MADFVKAGSRWLNLELIRRIDIDPHGGGGAIIYYVDGTPTETVGEPAATELEAALVSRDLIVMGAETLAHRVLEREYGDDKPEPKPAAGKPDCNGTCHGKARVDPLTN